MMNDIKIRAGILGASGYTGAELVRLLSQHPNVEIGAVAGDRSAGQEFGDVFAHLANVALPTLVSVDEIDYDALDVVFCGLPHATTQAVIAKIPTSVKVLDISADFRLDDSAVYKKWYGGDHQALDLQSTAVYGLTEFARDDIAAGRLIACPGCYPTSALLPLVPLLQAGLIGKQNIIIDSKSGVSGAGRGEKLGSLYTEVSEGIHAYGVGSHRHMPEIEQELSKAAGEEVLVSFTPHLIPMNRGILSTIYVQLTTNIDDAYGALAERYANERFVHVLPLGATPATRHVKGSNYAHIGVVADRRPNSAVIVCALDNLVKGASGQAIQNMNLMFGFPEARGLSQMPLFP
jgi:N-acetyl-gamma-glutamyl-phosphate reductase